MHTSAFPSRGVERWRNARRAKEPPIRAETLGERRDRVAILQLDGGAVDVRAVWWEEGADPRQGCRGRVQHRLDRAVPGGVGREQRGKGEGLWLRQCLDEAHL